ncbi:hypothetical protein [Haloarcula pellucida]|uniref:Uncharacterized protein n=1 Tax=Haloarcula pellucida TaxID=1427151 RepID=A0A830GLN6_9EURY|nr:hypothetical protein [Halomicroarcula pellucida]MBX0348667.1 hypothetical protein [Halomicroarcula pellucida]GGN92303.1 hypothetical protein GCM10009030_16430 [Halomicroarcula pellucida]
MAVGRNSRSTTVQLGEKDSAEAVVNMNAPGHHARVVVDRDGERWVFGVDGGEAALIETTEQVGLLDEVEVPAWVETVLWEVGVPEVDA